jgi:hypothetical protein
MALCFTESIRAFILWEFWADL